MRIIFSRKGFDTGSGGAPSPIINGKPISLPIPTKGRSTTTYRDLGLGDMVERVTRGKIDADHLCHEDPMFFDGYCLFGQCDAAQSHLKRQGVDIGDVFLFFGLFADRYFRDRHHRLYGYMRVDQMIEGDELHSEHRLIKKALRPHPHTIGNWNTTNCIYAGPGKRAQTADPLLRLTTEGGPLQLWDVPAWLAKTGLSYHNRKDRWLPGNQLQIVSRGQEFVTNIGERRKPRRWLEDIMKAIER
ncbi:hypothetical protein [Methylocella sp. CPCC 101449]|uniref:Nmad3 family putative nucleotide modification protein n=1 Tax=Methylocella sp. CPCC 101449 TaxID=2987531 RepID=UPI00289119FE|nr:hypothetical protein [Methylocella sp. CPCC 101449]MDT2022300.1 hypothetical protein [Methylocella sp. CPCC 101449]